MTAKSASAALGALGVEIYGEVGEVFDPNIHNAVMHIEDETLGEGVAPLEGVEILAVRKGRAVADMLPNLNAENVVIEKKGKLITFTVGTDKFKFDLIRQRPPKADKG